MESFAGDPFWCKIIFFFGGGVIVVSQNLVFFSFWETDLHLRR